MVDVAVGLVEVAVVVVVGAVPLVVLGQVRLDVGVGLAGRLLLLDPRGHAVADEVLDVRAVVGAAVVGAVTRLVVGDLDPVRDLAVDRVAARRRLLVVGLQRVDSLARTEVQVLEVLAAVVLLPGRAVVLGTVRLGYLVVQRAGRTAVLGLQVRRVVVGAVDQRRVVDLVAELRQDREDLVGPLPAQLDVLVLAELHDLRAVALDDLRLPGEHLLQRGLALLLHLLAEGAADDVPLAPVRLAVRRGTSYGRGVGLGARREDRSGSRGRGQRHEHGGGSQRPSLGGHLMVPLLRGVSATCHK